MFDPIASEWQQVRNQPWKILTDILTPWIEKWILTHFSLQKEQQKGGFLLIDIGAGSGRHTSFFQHYSRFVVDVDISREMLVINQQSSIKIQAAAEFLPFRENKADLISSIATIHHISSQEKRIQTISEINRVLRVKGFVVLTVWRFYQPKFLKQYIEQMHKASFQKTSYEIGDVDVPWHSITNPEKIYHRFYHLYRAAEFSSTVRIFEKWVKMSFGKKSNRENFLFIGLKRQI
jgi:ubiquinone/menaquinone biosynthesis C-methylase UbiE